jgi:hypothetical protein
MYVWSGVTIDPSLLAGYGYNDPIVVGGASYPRYLAYAVAAYADTDAARTAAAASATAAAASASGITGQGARNYIMNPQFKVQQRGAGPFTTTPVYTADRWQTFFLNGSMSTTIAAASDADRTAIGDQSVSNYLQAVVVAGGAISDYAAVSQSIEDVRRLAGRQVIISFMACVTSGTPKVGVEILQGFGAGGSTSVYSIVAQAVTLSTTWTRYSVSATIPVVTGKTISTGNDSSTALTFWISAGSNFNARTGSVGSQSYTLKLANIMVEESSTTAGPFRSIDLGGDLLACKRYYQVGTWSMATYGTAGSTQQAMRGLPVTLRAAPSLTISTSASVNCSTPSITTLAYYDTVLFAYNHTATGVASANGSFSVSADI